MPDRVNIADAVITKPAAEHADCVADDCGGSFSAPTFTWNLGALDAGSSASCTLTVGVVATGSIANTATIASSASDPQAANNAGVSTLAGVQLANVVIALSANASSGLEVRHSPTVIGSNAGPGSAIDLDFRIVMSDSVSILGNSRRHGQRYQPRLERGDLGQRREHRLHRQRSGLAAADHRASNSGLCQQRSRLGNNTASLVLGTIATRVPSQSRSALLLPILLIAGLGLLAVRART
ncbi:MAG: DUF11 domain-containing protein [Lysobacteraceae bacterium]